MTKAQFTTLNVFLKVGSASCGPAILMATQTSVSAERAASITGDATFGLMAAIRTMMTLLGFGVVLRATRRRDR